MAETSNPKPIANPKPIEEPKPIKKEPKPSAEPKSQNAVSDDEKVGAPGTVDGTTPPTPEPTITSDQQRIAELLQRIDRLEKIQDNVTTFKETDVGVTAKPEADVISPYQKLKKQRKGK